jgi:hypothetical protein
MDKFVADATDVIDTAVKNREVPCICDGWKTGESKEFPWSPAARHERCVVCF